MEKYDLLILILDKDSYMLEASGCELAGFKQRYALDNSSFVVIYLGEAASRVIAGQRISEINSLPPFDDTGAGQDAILSIKSWIYEARVNTLTGDSAMTRTAIFVDASDDPLIKHEIIPAKILGGLNETDYFQKYDCGERTNNNGGKSSFELVNVNPIEILEALASEGDQQALYELGFAYATGDGVEKNNIKAQRMLYKAYLHGNIEAIFALVDLTEDPAEHFLREAARHSHKNRNAE